MEKKIAQLADRGLNAFARRLSELNCTLWCHRYEVPEELKQAPKEAQK